jgi:cytochrome c peroxidase
MAMGPDRIVPSPSLITGDPVGDEPRHTLTILNAAFNGRETPLPTADSFQLWDGFADHGLESQAILPIVVPDEMAGDAYGQPAPWVAERVIQDSVAARVRDIPEYVRMFKDAFPSEVITASDLDIGHIARAISAFERELITPGSRYDQFVAGDRDVFSPREKQGFQIFFGKALCGSCHFGPMLSDFTYRVQGVADQYYVMMPGFEGKNFNGGDWGRFHADDAVYTDMKLAFRVPTIRNVEITAPYFHTGSAATLREVLEFYNHPDHEPMAFRDSYFDEHGVVRDPSIVELGLSDPEIEAIIAFMKTTTADVQTTGPLGTAINEIPERVPSGLLPPGIPTPDGPGPFYPEP